MNDNAFQDSYPDELSHCYGCGKNNAEGHHLKSFWRENSHEHVDQTIAHFRPSIYHTAIPGFVYGGLLASLIDCHGTGSAAAMAYRKDGRAMGTLPAHRFVTAALNISYLAPTPIGTELELIGTFNVIKTNKIVVDITLSANNIVCANGSVVAVKMPESMANFNCSA